MNINKNVNINKSVNIKQNVSVVRMLWLNEMQTMTTEVTGVPAAGRKCMTELDTNYLALHSFNFIYNTMIQVTRVYIT